MDDKWLKNTTILLVKTNPLLQLPVHNGEWYIGCLENATKVSSMHSFIFPWSQHIVQGAFIAGYAANGEWSTKCITPSNCLVLETSLQEEVKSFKKTCALAVLLHKYDLIWGQCCDIQGRGQVFHITDFLRAFIKAMCCWWLKSHVWSIATLSCRKACRLWPLYAGIGVPKCFDDLWG